MGTVLQESRELRARRVSYSLLSKNKRNLPVVKVKVTNSNFYVLMICPERKEVIFSASSLDSSVKRGTKHSLTVDVVKQVAEIFANKCRTVSITDVVFDRGGHKYHGRVKQCAETLRASGLVM